jgi:alpha-L-fucosidase 2
MDMQILRDLFAHTIKAAELLHKDELLRRDLTSLRNQLRPTSVGKDGRINEWPDHLIPNEPERNHRHTSHLYGLYPSFQITPDDTRELADGCAATLRERGPAETGWAAAWRLNLYARLRRSAEAWRMLQTLLCEMTYPNMFDVHPPLSKAYSLGTFQIDGNLGGAAGICEMLVQSSAGTGDVLLLPALPSQLAEGSITGIRIRGGWTVDLSWERTEAKQVLLRAGVAGTRRVSCGVFTRTVTLGVGEQQTLIGPNLEPA